MILVWTDSIHLEAILTPTHGTNKQTDGNDITIRIQTKPVWAITARTTGRVKEIYDGDKRTREEKTINQAQVPRCPRIFHCSLVRCCGPVLPGFCFLLRRLFNPRSKPLLTNHSPTSVSPHLEFVTGGGGGGFHSPGPALTTSRGCYFEGDPRPAPVRGESPLIPWTGPRFSPPVLTGTRRGDGRGRGQGQGTLKKHGLPQAVQRGGAGNWAGGPGFSGPLRPRNEH